MTKIAISELRKILSYDADDGTFYWLQDTRNTKRGALAGNYRTNGYGQLQIKNQNYRMHVLAWALQTGSWPTKIIDHVNRVPSDNRWANLREATVKQNSQNCVHQSRLGLPRGVRPNHKKFIAKLWVGSKWKCLGTYDTPQEAHEVYLRAEYEYKRQFAPVFNV